MKVDQVIEQLKGFSREELTELMFEIEKIQLIRASHEASKRWAGKKIEFRSPVVIQEPPNPFKELLQMQKS